LSEWKKKQAEIINVILQRHQEKKATNTFVSSCIMMIILVVTAL
jgi:hypothetical protein